ncbi:hypothetical protein P7H15_17845 [Paenibacillus larvae]|nr:hypothetical protein [Paenibacillus larvae]MDT2294305.1 hypothetical protein [Paenibacillus larvae]
MEKHTLATIAIPLLNKLASKIGVAYMPALVFLIVIILGAWLIGAYDDGIIQTPGDH